MVHGMVSIVSFSGLRMECLPKGVHEWQPAPPFWVEADAENMQSTVGIHDGCKKGTVSSQSSRRASSTRRGSQLPASIEEQGFQLPLLILLQVAQLWSRLQLLGGCARMLWRRFRDNAWWRPTLVIGSQALGGSLMAFALQMVAWAWMTLTCLQTGIRSTVSGMTLQSWQQNCHVNLMSWIPPHVTMQPATWSVGYANWVLAWVWPPSTFMLWHRCSRMVAWLFQIGVQIRVPKVFKGESANLTSLQCWGCAAVMVMSYGHESWWFGIW